MIDLIILTISLVLGLAGLILCIKIIPRCSGHLRSSLISLLLGIFSFIIANINYLVFTGGFIFNIPISKEDVSTTLIIIIGTFFLIFFVLLSLFFIWRMIIDLEK